MRRTRAGFKPVNGYEVLSRRFQIGDGPDAKTVNHHADRVAKSGLFSQDNLFRIFERDEQCPPFSVCG
jgi:hypothetical protein